MLAPKLRILTVPLTDHMNLNMKEGQSVDKRGRRKGKGRAHMEKAGEKSRGPGD